MTGRVIDFGVSPAEQLKASVGGQVVDFGESPNEEIARIANEKRIEALEGGVPEAFPEVPSLPNDSVPSSGGEGVTMGEEIRQAVSPVLNPVMEVVDTINNTVYGTAYDAFVRTPAYWASTGYENIKNVVQAADPNVDYEGLEWGSAPDIPDILKNKTFVADEDTERFLDRGGQYAGIGMNVTAAARVFVNQLGKGLLKWNKKGARLDPVTGKTMTGVEGGRVGIARELSRQKMPTEVEQALRMAGAGFVAGELAESDSPLISIPAELAAAVLRKPATYFDIATGLTRSADTGTEVAAKRVKTQFEKQFGVDVMDTAASRAKGLADDGYEAELALRAAQKSGDDEVLSVAQQTDDAGLLVGERALAAEDAVFAGKIDDQLDQAQYSLAKEMEALLDPTTGAYNWKAVEELLPKIKDDLLSGVDDRVRIAHEEMAAMLNIFGGDKTKMSKEFNRQFEKVFADINKQEDKLWGPINRAGFQLDTTGFKRAINDIVEKSNRETALPAEKFAEYLGAGLMRTDKGWKTVPLSLKGDKKFKPKYPIVWPKVPMGDKQSPQVMKTIRTSLNEMVRDPNITVDVDAAVKAQDAAVQALTDGVGTVPAAFRNSYLAATAYSKKSHETFTHGTLMPKVKKAVPEKKLEIAMAGQTKSESDMNIVAREFEEVLNLAPPRSQQAQSQMLKSAEASLKAKFAEQVDPTDIASFDAFIAAHKTAFKRFPEAGRMIKAARAKAKRQGVVVKNRELKAEAARVDIFTNLVGKTPDEVMDTILKSAEPMKNARRFRLMLGKSPEAKTAFQDAVARRVIGQSLEFITAQVKGKGTIEVINKAKFDKTLDELSPLLETFKGKELKGLKMLQGQLKSLEKTLSAKGAEALEDYSPPLALRLAAQLGGIKAVNLLFGSSSIVLAGTASNQATQALQRLGYAQADKVLKEAYRNPELMKILLSRNITQTQLKELNSGKYVVGRTLYKILTGEAVEE
jgi:hypothetical protein